MKNSNLMLVMSFSSILLNAAEQTTKGPMDPHWFYGEHAYTKANALHQERKWKDAEGLYEELLKQKAGSEYDQENAQLNKAACSWAQRKSSEGWKSFDALLGIEKEQRISEDDLKDAKQKPKKSVLIETGKVGIGDIVHFLKAAGELKQQTGWDVTISVPNFLKGTLSGATTAYGLNVVGARDEQPKTDRTTHLVSLLGHLKMNPSSVAPEKPLFTAPERAEKAVAAQITALLQRGKIVGVAFAGEDRQATLIGGRKLPLDSEQHGRHLNSQPFMNLLKKHPELVIIDCGNGAGKLVVDEDVKDRCVPLAKEEQPFDTTLALALAMNVNKKIIAFGADNGPTNVFARALNKEAQKRMAFIIPNGSKDSGEYDMRMEGEGDVYTQGLSNCFVYKCATPANQAQVLEKAYQDMTADGHEVIL